MSLKHSLVAVAVELCPAGMSNLLDVSTAPPMIASYRQKVCRYIRLFSFSSIIATLPIPVTEKQSSTRHDTAASVFDGGFGGLPILGCSVDTPNCLAD